MRTLVGAAKVFVSTPAFSNNVQAVNPPIAMHNIIHKVKIATSFFFIKNLLNKKVPFAKQTAHRKNVLSPCCDAI